MSRAKLVAYWAIPLVFCLGVYWLGLWAWFASDDFAWLSLYSHVHSWSDFLSEMFTPRAQGTIRPLSERGFFMLFFWLFGLDAPCYRAFVMLTQLANVALVAWIGWRISANRMAGFAAAILWTVNPSLSYPMAWTSAYNQILCAFFLLTAFALFLKHVETHRWSWYAAQWAVFLLGFGALELNVVYPALALSYTLFCARNFWWKPLPMFAASAFYMGMRSLLVPMPSAAYTLYWDGSIFSTAWQYLRLATGCVQVAKLGWGTPTLRETGTLFVLTGLVVFLGRKAYRHDYRALFYASWFILVLSPVLPFRDHFSDYYLCIPTIGLAWLGGWAAAELSQHQSFAIKAAAAAVVLVYFTCSLAATQTAVRWIYERSLPLRMLVLGLARVQELYPGKIILLQGVSTDLFLGALAHKPEAVLGLPGLYLAPGSEVQIEARKGFAVQDYVLSESAARRALEADHAVVYDASAGPLRNVTNLVREGLAKSWSTAAPSVIDVSNPDLAYLLGPTWYRITNGIRWMPQSATVKIEGPRSASDHLCLSGYVDPRLIENGGLQLALTLDSEPPRTIRIAHDGEFNECTSLPLRAVGRKEVALVLESNRTFRPGKDLRKLSIAFGKFSIR